MPFPKNFVWGAATSSYQIEGAVHEGGRGPSIWDTFCATPGKVFQGHNGAVACDHYNRLEQDLDMMAELGLKAYRFSLAWPRILPTGLEKEPNAAGLDFYDRLVDGLLERGITPWATLYHWDLPQPLHDAGGWPWRGICEHFVRFADVSSRRLGDRVGHWITHNEPWVVSMLGYKTGEHAPGIQDMDQALAAAHHVLLSHGMAVPVIRANAPGAKVGITLNLCPSWPASNSAADQRAAREFDGHFNRWFLDPCYGRGYPRDMEQHYLEQGHKLPPVQPGDVQIMGVKTDFLGINYYSRGIIRGPEEGNLPQTVHSTGVETDMGWEVHAPSLERLLVRLAADYPVGELYITENGAAYPEEPGEDGKVHDARRQDYLQQHIAACENAIGRGAPLAGYFAWSLMDNFEWAFGYEKRFGLVHVDYETLERTPKESALWYRGVIERGGL